MPSSSHIPPNPLPNHTPINCWDSSGSWGDRSCSSLPTYLHCLQCPTYKQATLQLLNRPAPQGYLEAFKESIKQPSTDAPTNLLPTLVFRIHNEWCALPCSYLKEIIAVGFVHKIPYLKSSIIQGLTNVHGELHLVIDLKSLLNIDSSLPFPSPQFQTITYSRFILFGSNSSLFVFPAEEISGVYHIDSSNLNPVPSGIFQNNPFIQGTFLINNTPTALLLPDSLLKKLSTDCL